MRIIKKNELNQDIDKIIANMLNIENAYTIYNDDLTLNKNVTFFPNISRSWPAAATETNDGVDGGDSLFPHGGRNTPPLNCFKK